jgi:tetratricopeptide (TPR) repeat protein
MTFPRFSKWVVAANLMAVGGLSLALGGCAEVLTYAQDNRETGIVAYNQGDYPKAAGAFRSALRQDPRDYLSHYYLGLASLELANYQQAIVAFRSCLDTSKVTLAGQDDEATRLKALEGLAQAITKTDDSDLEVNKVEQSARAQTGKLAAREFFVLGKVYRYRKLPDVSLEYYGRATLNDPKNFAFAKEYGLYCEQLQQVDRAREALRQAFAVDATDKEVNDALRRLGIVLGPSLKDKIDLAAPPLPKGPIPEVDMTKLGLGGGGNKTTTTATGGGTNEVQPARSIIRPGQNGPRD